MRWNQMHDSSLRIPFTSSSQLPIGIYAPKHERIPTSHREILDRVTRDMEAGRLGTFAIPQTLATPDGNRHGCLGVSGHNVNLFLI